MGIHPLHINQMFAGECGSPMFQYAWQHPGQLGREDLAYAIHNAEDLISDFLGFYPKATWSEEVYPISSRTIRPLVTGRGMFIEGGKEAKTVVAADKAVGTLGETMTFTQAVTFTDPEELAIFYPGHSGDDAWEITPVLVSISTGTASITVKKWQLVKESLLEDLEAEEVDYTDSGNFLTTVDVYRRYNDPSVQAQFEGFQAACFSCSGSGCVSCTAVEQSACIKAMYPEQGVLGFTPATWDDDNSRFLGAEWACAADKPLRVRAWLRSGWRDPRRATFRNTIMDPRLERAIAILTMAIIGDEGLCVCLSRIHERWAVDLAKQESGDVATSFKMSREDLRNVFGTTRGGLEAWRLVREVRNGTAV